MELFVMRGGNQEGPYTQEQIEEMLTDGRLVPEDMVAAEEWTDWRPLAEVIVSRPGGMPVAQPAPLEG